MMCGGPNYSPQITFTYTSGAPVVKRTLIIPSDAEWITHAMQRYALEK